MGGMILIEGLDLAGKSTLVRGLAALLEDMKIPFRVSHNSLCPENPVARFADWMRRDQGRGSLEGSCLFLAAHLWDVRNFQPSRDLHIQDSCWLRAHAYDVENRSLWAHAPSVKFDRALFLTASLPVRQERLHQRKLEGGAADAQDHWVHSDPDRFCEMEARLLTVVSQHAPTEVLDTTELNAREVLQQSLRLLDLAQLCPLSAYI